MAIGLTFAGINILTISTSPLTNTMLQQLWFCHTTTVIICSYYNLLKVKDYQVTVGLTSTCLQREINLGVMFRLGLLLQISSSPIPHNAGLAMIQFTDWKFLLTKILTSSSASSKHHADIAWKFILDDPVGCSQKKL